MQVLVNMDDMSKVLTLCEEDKNTRSICKTKSFWKKRYIKDDMPFYKYYTTLHLNFLEYRYSKLCTNITNDLLQLLIEDHKHLKLYIKSPEYIKIFNNNRISEIFLDKLYYIIDQNYNDEDYDELNIFIKISFNLEDNIFEVDIPDEENKFTYDIKDMFNILYNVCYKKLSYILY
jgi:hypothetical protein